MKTMDKSKYLGIKESFLLVFLYSFLLKKIIIFLFSSIFYLLTKEGYWTFIIVGTCIGILSWAAAIYCTNQYIDHRKWYDTSNAYKIQLKPLFIGLMAVVMIYTNRNEIRRSLYRVFCYEDLEKNDLIHLRHQKDTFQT